MPHGGRGAGAGQSGGLQYVEHSSALESESSELRTAEANPHQSPSSAELREHNPAFSKNPGFSIPDEEQT